MPNLSLIISGVWHQTRFSHDHSTLSVARLARFHDQVRKPRYQYTAYEQPRSGHIVQLSRVGTFVDNKPLHDPKASPNNFYKGYRNASEVCECGILTAFLLQVSGTGQVANERGSH